MLRFDLHVHTSHSYDGLCSVKDVVKAAKKKGLNGIAITDHDTVDAHDDAKKFSSRDFLIILGLEISSANGHVLGLGVDELIPRKLSAKETVKLITKKGGIAIAAHPFTLKQKPGIINKAKFDAIEVLNSRAFLLANPLARRFAERNRLPMVAGSDAHHYDDVGMASTILNCESDVDSILDEIRRGGTSITGRTLPPLRYPWRILQKSLHR